MTEQEVLEALQSGETAEALLLERMPHVRRRFDRMCIMMKKLLDDVQEEFPDAEYYSASGTLHLILGCSHSSSGSPQQGLVALSDDHCLQIGGGDW